MGERAGAAQALVEGFADDAALVPALRGWCVIRHRGWRGSRHCCTPVCHSRLWAAATAAIGVAATAATAGVLGATAEARHGGAEAQTPPVGETANCGESTDEHWGPAAHDRDAWWALLLSAGTWSGVHVEVSSLCRDKRIQGQGLLQHQLYHHCNHHSLARHSFSASHS